MKLGKVFTWLAASLFGIGVYFPMIFVVGAVNTLLRTCLPQEVYGHASSILIYALASFFFITVYGFKVFLEEERLTLGDLPARIVYALAGAITGGVAGHLVLLLFDLLWAKVSGLGVIAGFILMFWAPLMSVAVAFTGVIVYESLRMRKKPLQVLREWVE